MLLLYLCHGSDGKLAALHLHQAADEQNHVFAWLRGIATELVDIDSDVMKEDVSVDESARAQIALNAARDDDVKTAEVSEPMALSEVATASAVLRRDRVGDVDVVSVVRGYEGHAKLRCQRHGLDCIEAEVSVDEARLESTKAGHEERRQVKALK
jgi:hypothetical protein